MISRTSRQITTTTKKIDDNIEIIGPPHMALKIKIGATPEIKAPIGVAFIWGFDCVDTLRIIEPVTSGAFTINVQSTSLNKKSSDRKLFLLSKGGHGSTTSGKLGIPWVWMIGSSTHENVDPSALLAKFSR